MNKPHHLSWIRKKDNRFDRSDDSNDYRRRGLSSAEQIVTLILRKYGLDRESTEESEETQNQKLADRASNETRPVHTLETAESISVPTALDPGAANALKNAQQLTFGWHT